MENLHQPVYRVGKIIRGDGSLERKEALEVAGLLCDQSDDIVEQAVAEINGASIPQLSENALQVTRLESDRARPSPRIDPTIVVDFPRFIIKVDDVAIESRFCITVCVGEKRSKIWQRFNLIEGVVDNPAHYYSACEQLADKLFAILLPFYATHLESKKQDIEAAFTLDIRCAVSDLEVVESAFQAHFGNMINPSQNTFDRKEIEALLQKMDPSIQEFPSQWGYQRDADGGVNQEQLLGFSARRAPRPPKQLHFDHSKEQHYVSAENRNLDGDVIERHQPSPESLEGADYDLNALFLLRIDKEGAHFTAIGYERDPSRFSHGRSLSSIISGELSTEYGTAF